MAEPSFSRGNNEDTYDGERTMTRNAIIIALAALFVGGSALSAQNVPQIPADQQAKKLPRQTLSGPRFGFTTFTIARMRGRGV